MSKFTAAQRDAYRAKARDRQQELLATLEARVKAIQSSDEFTAWLKTAARFHRYSYNNQLLIILQRPEATRVAGYTTWQRLGRQVRKGESGIAIFAPMTVMVGGEDADGTVDEPRAITRFKVEHVFDIAQTDGAELPDFQVDALEGPCELDLFTTLTTIAEARGLTVTQVDPNPGAEHASYRGYYDPLKQLIYVRPASPAQAMKTLIHELGHALDDGLRGSPPPEQETVAEATAYVVSAHFGLDTGAYSFRYIARWAREQDGTEILRRSMARIQKISKTLIDDITNALAVEEHA